MVVGPQLLYCIACFSIKKGTIELDVWLLGHSCCAACLGVNKRNEVASRFGRRCCADCFDV